MDEFTLLWPWSSRWSWHLWLPYKLGKFWQIVPNIWITSILHAHFLLDKIVKMFTLTFLALASWSNFTMTCKNNKLLSDFWLWGHLFCRRASLVQVGDRSHPLTTGDVPDYREPYETQSECIAVWLRTGENKVIENHVRLSQSITVWLRAGENKVMENHVRLSQSV